MAVVALHVKVPVEETVKYYHGFSRTLADLTSLADAFGAKLQPLYRNDLLTKPRLIDDSELPLLSHFSIVDLPEAQLEAFKIKLSYLAGVETIATLRAPKQKAAAKAAQHQPRGR